ncbi:Saccharopine dehydrogenase [Burkholderia ubonensis]|nr:saccharopine dehydrogenase [Burkholderia ubonensis]
MIYGAYGYTGELVVREAVRQGMPPIIAGRDGKKLKPLAFGQFPPITTDDDRPGSDIRAYRGMSAPRPVPAETLRRGCLRVPCFNNGVTTRISLPEP